MRTLLITLALCAFALSQEQQRIDLNAAIVAYRAKSDAATQEFIQAVSLIQQLSVEAQKLRAENDSLKAILKPKKEKDK